MVIDGAWEKKIFRLWRDREYDKAKREVFRYRLRNYEKLKRIEDKVFLDYRMAHLEYILKNKEMANFYFKCLEDIFSDKYNRESMEYDYYRYKWLYVNNNEDTLSNAEKINQMMEIYNYYKLNKRDDLAFTALENVSKIKGNEDEILINLENLLNEDKIQEWNLVESILEDCDKISHSLYIKALDIVNKYKININVV
jgi:hypothetical protein